jgi:tetratricopeptide (TPR) repeat protein
MKSFVRLVLVLLCVSAAWLRAEEKPVPAKAAEDLKVIVERQRELLAQAAKKNSQDDGEDLRAPFQALVFDYEAYLTKYPDVAAGYVSYAMLLNQPVLDERKRAVALLLKANQLDSDLPLVKNQLGNHLAEEGKPLEALNYYLAAVKLAPKEPLYHYQIGTLLTEARDEFLKNPPWTRAMLDQAMQDAFEQASALAPGNIAYAYRFGESFYDLERPEWSAALEWWRALEEKVETPIEKETMRLHQANVLIHQAKFAEARALLATVKEVTLQTQKKKLFAQLPEVPAK